MLCHRALYMLQRNCIIRNLEKLLQFLGILPKICFDQEYSKTPKIFRDIIILLKLKAHNFTIFARDIDANNHHHVLLFVILPNLADILCQLIRM